jgi:hypothetical protein
MQGVVEGSVDLIDSGSPGDADLDSLEKPQRLGTRRVQYLLRHRPELESERVWST